MSLFINLKKLGVNTTVLATSISLVACGGGGSDGYYDQGNNNQSGSGGSSETGNESTNNTAQIPESLNIALQDQNGQSTVQVVDNSTIQIAVQVLNTDKGGISGKNVRLSVDDKEKIGVTSKSSLVATTDNGVAIFELNVPTMNIESGKVQLTAWVDGTEVKQLYTLNIKKSSVIVSDYNLEVPQGLTLDLPRGTTEFSVQVTDKKGGVKSAQTVELTLPTELQGMFVITNGSSVQTDNEGKANFKIAANSNLTSDQIKSLVNSSKTLNFKLIDENRAEKNAVTSITFKDISTVVNKLEIIKPDTAIQAKNGKAVIRVYAKNTNNKDLEGKKVRLETNQSSRLVTLDKSEAITNAEGYAEFVLASKTDTPIALSQEGIELKATYVDNTNIFANVKVDVITTDESAKDQEAIQRLEIASSYKINAISDSVEIKVKAIANNGHAAKKGKIKLTLNSEAVANAVKFEGSSDGVNFDLNESQTVGKDGYVTFRIKTPASQTATAVEALKASGITATFTTENNITSSIKIVVEDEVVATEAVKYLLIDPINENFDPTKNQEITIKVKAIGEKGGPLKNEKVVIKSLLSDDQLNKLSLSLRTAAEVLTDADGYATFIYDYKYNKTAEQQALAKQGITFTSTALSNQKNQTIKVNFNTKSVSDKVDLDYFTLDTDGVAQIGLSQETEIVVRAQAIGIDGKALANQELSIGIDETAISNGVSYATATKLVSNAQGNVEFKLKVAARNLTELNTLIEKGVTVAVISYRNDGSRHVITRKVELAANSIIETGPSQVDYLMVDPILTRFDYTQNQEITVRVKALDVNGSPLAKEKIQLKSALTNQQMQKLGLSFTTQAEQITDASGYATFKLSYQYDATPEQEELAKKGLTFNALSNGKVSNIQINFKAPSDTVDLSFFTVDTDGQALISTATDTPIKIRVKAMGTDGKVLANQRISIGIDNTAVSNGITYTSANSLVTDASGNAEFVLSAKPKNKDELNALLASGVTVAVKATAKDGSEYTTLRTIKLVEQEQASQVSSLLIDPLQAAYDYTQDQTIQVRVKAIGQAGQSLRNEKVSLTTVFSAQELADLNISLVGDATKLTDDYGYATFTFDYKYNAQSPAQKKLLNGFEVTATANGKSNNTIINFKEPVNEQEIKLDYLVVSTGGRAVISTDNPIEVVVNVTALATNGTALKDQSVKIELDESETNRGISFNSSTEVLTNAQGQASFKVKIAPENASELEALLASGLNVRLSAQRADGSAYKVSRKVELYKSEAEAPSEVDYLIIDPISVYDYSKNHTIAVRVKAMGEDGSALRNEKITLRPENISSAELAKLNLSLNGATEQYTDDQGYAVFEFSYNYDAQSTEQKPLALKGVNLLATANGKEQRTVINFAETQTNTLDYLVIDMIGKAVIDIDTETKVALSVLAKGTDGAVLANQNVQIELTNENGINLLTASSVATDAEGYAKFEFSVHPKNQQELEALLANGVTVKVLSAVADGSVRQAQRKVELVQAEEQFESKVETLVIDPVLNSFDYTQDHKIQVRVKALDVDGGTLKNEKVAITTDVQNKLAQLNFSLNGAAEQFTGDDGYATFVFEYQYANTTVQRDILNGVTVTATANGKTQTAKLNFRESLTSEALDYISIDTDGYAAIEENVQTDITVKVRAINVGGTALANQDVTISYNEQAHKNGIYLLDPTGANIGAQTFAQKTDADGYVTFTFKALPRNKVEVQNLISDLESGDLQVTLTAKRADGSNYEAFRRIDLRAPNVESTPAEVLIDPILQAFDYSKDQRIIVPVKALSSDKGALQGAKVTIDTPNLTLEQLKTAQLTLTGEATKLTDANGYAYFEFEYKVANTQEQINILSSGVRVTATTSNGKIAVQTLNFKSPNAGQILDYFTLNASDYVIALGVNTSKTIQVTINAKDIEGKPFANQVVSLGLNQAALSNGVSFVSPSQVMTDSNGLAIFEVTINPQSEMEIENLAANDLEFTATARRVDGSEYTLVRKIELEKPAIVYPDLANNGITLEYVGVQTVSVLGGEVLVKVIAKAADGTLIANTPLAIATSTQNPRVSISDNTLITNSKGEAIFTVRVTEGNYDASLIKSGITFAVIATNLNTGERIQQTGSIQVNIPQDSVNLRMTADTRNVEYGKSYPIYVAVKDELGANTTGYPVQLTLNQAARDAGVKLSAESVMSVANGSVPVSLIIPNNLSNVAKQRLQDTGVIVNASIKNPKGVEIKAELPFTVLAAENPYFISMELNNPIISSAGASSTVTAKLMDKNGGAIKNQELNLSLDEFLVTNSEWKNKVYINGASTVRTDELGNAVFEVVIPKSAESSLISYLEINGINVTATHIAENGVNRTQLAKITVKSPTAESFPQYAIKLKSSKISLSAIGDTTDVSVYLLDEKGGGVEGKAVSLAIKNSRVNGVMIVGPSMLSTDNMGEAKFSIRLDPSLANISEINDLITNGVELTVTHFNGENNITQPLTIPVRNIDAVQEKLSIVIARDTINLEEDTTREYYLQNVSVSVQDQFGKPVAQQEVSMDVDAIGYRVGQYDYGIPVDPTKFVSFTTDWFNDVVELWNKDTYQKMNDIYPSVYCPITNGKADETIIVDVSREVPTNVVNFVGHNTQGNFTRYTDERGRIDFQIRYPKRFGSWLTVELSASTDKSTQPKTNYYSFTLPVASPDITATTHPAILSPYYGSYTWDAVQSKYTCN
ncbi:hypothetical protein [Acinetobacter lwoffii]|uniref:Ig-like domain-containing protein n=1 Tax=Acinetobacter lwoffii TaxID=28090 RepID=A0A6N1MS88_ACILW|nr:hypothetical protein [Acinetobacter lwoffii]QKU20637.1 hypothetical protein FOB19_03865 [Acinetobacter lwoffii]